MLKFLIQTDKKTKQVLHDFSFALLESIHYQEWKGNHITYRFWNQPIEEMKNKKFKEWIPIGSTEFVEYHLNYFYQHQPKPINVPEELFPFAGRMIKNGTKNDVDNTQPLFVKSHEKIKYFAEFIETESDLALLEDGHTYQISSVMDIISEWRVFVFLGEVVGIQNYLGNFTIFPNINAVYQMVKIWTKAPRSYVMDVVVTKNGTHVIECHDFFSCGFYGFNDIARIPYMFAYWFQGIKDTQKNLTVRCKEHIIKP